MERQSELVARLLGEIGARVRFNVPARGGFAGQARLNVLRDRKGEYFFVPPDLDAEVVDRDRERCHALLLVRDGGEKQKYLLGRDERHWFVAAVPGASVRSVATAMAALVPEGGAGGMRQGEWFFVPRPDFETTNPIHRGEPLRRNQRSKPHWCEELVRTGGTQVYVSRSHPLGITEPELSALRASDPKARRMQWQRATRDAKVFVRGCVRHEDHATLRLGMVWHEVYLNNERFASWANEIAFLD